MDTCYALITEAFKKLEEAGAAHALNHQQKVQIFESILKKNYFS